MYLPAFERVVKEAHVGSVMSAYNKVNGAYCSENAHLLHDLLEDDWGFDGFVESDWVFGTHSAAPAANAGLDIEMPVGSYFGEDLREAVRTGNVKMRTIDASVRRILRKKLAFGLDRPAAPDPGVVESEAHLALAREVARRSIVLLKNEGGVLPLDRSAIGSVVVVGDLAKVANLGDLGSSAVTPSRAISPLEGIERAASGARVDRVGGSTLAADDEALIRAADAAIVVVGLTAADEGENVLIGGGDRAELGLSAAHVRLVEAVAAANARTIVVLEGGSALTMDPWIDRVAGVLMAWYPGSEGGAAIGEILFGDVNPSGKLPITFPRDAAQLPEFVSDADEVTYGYYHGYRHVDRAAIEPLFPFGFGLSYTHFRYGAVSLEASTLGPGDTLAAAVEVTNDGDRDGIEVVELYVGYPGFERRLPAPGAEGVRAGGPRRW